MTLTAAVGFDIMNDSFLFDMMTELLSVYHVCHSSAFIVAGWLEVTTHQTYFCNSAAFSLNRFVAMVDVEEGHDSAQIWHHFPWIDKIYNVEHHCVINTFLQPGFSIKWEWRYFHDTLGIKTDTWKLAPRSKKAISKLMFFQCLLVPLDNLFDDHDKVSKELTLPTLAVLAQLGFLSAARQAQSKHASLMTLLSLVAASFQGYHLVQATELLIRLDLSGPLPSQMSIGHMLISGTQHLHNMQPFINRYPEFETAWNSVVTTPWQNHIISSQLSDPLIADVIVVILMTVTKTNALDHGSWWLTFGH